MGQRVRRMRRLAVGALAGAALVAASGASQAGAQSFTWTGLDATSGNWSDGDNWQGGAAPAGSSDVLEFSSLTNPECAFPYQAACYDTVNDLVGLNVEELRLAGRQPYDLSGNAITLGSGGISANPGEIAGRNPDVLLPLQLGADQTWHVNGALVTVSGGMTGSSDLVVEIQHGSLLLGGENEVGSVTLRAPDGFGFVELRESGATLNASSGNSVHLENASLSGRGTLGPLTTSDARLVGTYAHASDPLKINGDVTLDPGTTVRAEIAALNNNNPSSYTRIDATGDVDLGSARLNANLGDPGLPYHCAPSEAEGRTYPLISTTGTVTGTFAGIPDGGIIVPEQKDYFYPVPEPGYIVYCPQYPLRIDYREHSVEATVLEPVIRERPSLNPPTAAIPTGERAAALKKCKKKYSKKARKKVAKRAQKKGKRWKKGWKKGRRKCRRKARRRPI